MLPHSSYFPDVATSEYHVFRFFKHFLVGENTGVSLIKLEQYNKMLYLVERSGESTMPDL